MRNISQYRLAAYANIRMQQRCIGEDALALLLNYGDETPAPRGAMRVFFSRQSLDDLAWDLGEDAVASQICDDAYAILAFDRTVLTVGHDRRRRPRRFGPQARRSPPLDARRPSGVSTRRGLPWRRYVAEDDSAGSDRQ